MGPDCFPDILSFYDRTVASAAGAAFVGLARVVFPVVLVVVTVRAGVDQLAAQIGLHRFVRFA